jgi:hypothetical protein
MSGLSRTCDASQPFAEETSAAPVSFADESQSG